MEQVSYAAMEVKNETQRALEWQLNELQKELRDTGNTDAPMSEAKLLAENPPSDIDGGNGRHDHDTGVNILDEALKEIAADTKPDMSDIKSVLLQTSGPIVSAVSCAEVTVPTQTLIACTPPTLPSENPGTIRVEVPKVSLPFKIESPRATIVANACDTRQIRVEIPKTALPNKVEQPLAVLTNASNSSQQIKVELPKVSLPIKVDSSLDVVSNNPDGAQINIELPKQAQVPIKIDPPHGVLTVEVPKVVSVVSTSCPSTAPTVTSVSIPQAITLNSVASSPSVQGVQAVPAVQGVQGGTYRLKTNAPLGNPVVGTPLMVTGVVIPRAPLSSNLISFVDAMGNMQLAAVASPLINPAIQIRPGMVVNPGTPLVVRPPAPQLVSPPGALGTIVPVSTLSTVQPPIFKSTVRAILPNKTTVKTIYPIKGMTTTTLNSEAKPNDAQTVATSPRAFTQAHDEPEEKLPSLVQPPPPQTIMQPSKESVYPEPKVEKPKNNPPPVVLPDTKLPVTEVTPPNQQQTNEATSLAKGPDEEDKANDVIFKIMSVSSSQGTNKAGDLAKTNLFNLLKTETNVVITAPSIHVQDILEELKKQFPDKKFVINYNSSNTASSNLKNLVTQAAVGKRAMKASMLKPQVTEKALAKRAAEDDKTAAPSAKRKRTQTFKKAAQTSKKATALSSTPKATPKRMKTEKTHEVPPVPKPAATYRSARLRGEKAPELFSGRRRKEETLAVTPQKFSKEPGTVRPVRARGRPRKDRSAATQPMKMAEQAIINSIRDVEGGSVRVGEGVDELMGGPVGEGEDSMGSSTTSGGSGGTGFGYNSEIRVGDEFQAEIPFLLEGNPPKDYSEHADIIYHPDKGLLNACRPEGSRFCQDFPLYDFVDWSHQDKKMFKRYLGTYKTKFGKYLAVLPNKRLLDVIDHYYSTHSPARDYVLPKKSKHYYLVSKSKQMIAPKGVFGILNEKRKVLPNRRFCANPNIVLYEDALPTRRPKDTAMREKTSTNSLPVASVAAAGAANASGAGGSGTNTSKTAKTDANGKPTKVVKFEDIMKPLAGGGKPNNENNKSERTDATAASSAENSDNESVPNSVDDSLDYAMRKARPPTEDFDDDVKEWISKESTAELPMIDENVETLKEKIGSLKKLFQRNKAELAQMDCEQKRIAKTVEQVTKAIGKARKITDEWTKEDRLLTIQAFKSFGKDFKAVSKLVGTKSEHAVKQFYETNSQRYGLDQPIVPSAETPAVVTPTGSSSPLKSGPDSPVRGPRPMPSILRRKISIKPLNV
ncbi:uncharacterized protein LOC111251578 isoform X2 [Varroa destructor]|uniref:SANT domain-containing protein n=1 Tax=Varroa destructor TaxID=109461 RepID=A0A7M7KAF5_VARDE|nr:uncharacterized protein LOC111251578 isoform X2 [Varroa destructor]